MISALKEQLEFIRQVRQRFYTTGPSCRAAGFWRTTRRGRSSSSRAQARAGTGTRHGSCDARDRQTYQSRRHVRSGRDQRRVRQRPEEPLRARSDYKKCAAVSKVHVCPLQEFQATAPYDIVISGLPFNNFSAPLVEELVDASLKLLAPGGTYSFFEYMFLRPIRRAVTFGPDRQRLKQIQRSWTASVTPTACGGTGSS